MNRPLLEKKTFWGFTAIGFVALAGGIIMFLVTVPKWQATGSEAPADMAIVFTKVYSIQANLRSGNLPFSPELSALGVDKETCAQFLCEMKLIEAGKDYDLRLSKNGRTWRITSKSMIPEEIRSEIRSEAEEKK